MKTLCITHTDMDGTGVAMAVLSRWPDCIVKFVDYGTIDEEVERAIADSAQYDTIVLADVLPGQELVKQLHDSDADVLVFDHHQGNDYLNEMVGCRWNEDECATLISTKELFPQPPERLLAFASMIDVWDRFQDDNANFSKASHLNMLHGFIGQDEFIERGPELRFDELDEFIITCLLTQLDKDTKTACEQLKAYKDQKGRTFGFIVGGYGEGQPLISHAVLKRFPKLEYLMVWGPHRNSVGLVSPKGGVDVSEIAKQRGGGGHVNASGYGAVDVSGLLAKKLSEGVG